MAPGARQIRSLQDAGIETEIVDMRGIPKLKYLQVLPRIRRAIRSVDLIHAHYGYCGWLGLMGRKLAMRKIPVVISYMGDDLLGTTINTQGDVEYLSRIQAKWNARIAPWYDQVIVKSQEMADLIAPTSCHVVSNGIDINVFQPVERTLARRQIGLDANGLKVLFPGNPNNVRKGHALASEAVEIAAKILDQKIQLVPLWGVKPDAVPLYMNACDAMLMTSFIEGSPNVVKEGLACNLKIVGVPVGDVPEMLAGIVGCHCASSRDPQEIGQALARLLKAGGESAGRLAIQTRGLDLASVARRIISIYELALKRTPG
jgi:glycosyltransferase involved in cell wall biosynthesis